MTSENPRADSEVTDKLIGETLANRYKIEHRLGEGAMGTVYKARHVKVGRAFAVKVLHPRLIIDGKVLQRFEREAELAGRLHHPNVIGVVDVGETSDGLRYMVMDFAEGPDLAVLLQEAPMPPLRITKLVRQLLDGLFHAHEQGLIHRDFKPENVIVERNADGAEVPRIVDFGIAILREGGDGTDGMGRLTTNGLVLGTPHYMAPEQAVADPIDHRIDLFALGIIIYELLSGKLPFDGTGAEVARANLLLDPPVISDRVPHLEVDPLLEAFARRLMAKKRDLRPPTAKAARDLLDLIEHDRAAAAAALNVSPVTASRTPKTTESAAPRHVSNDYPGTFPPPFRELPEPVPVPTRDQLSTQVAAHAAEPPRPRRSLVIAAIVGAVAILAIVIVVLARGSHADAPKVAAVEPAPPPASPKPDVTVGSAVATPPVAPNPPVVVVDRDPTPAPVEHKPKPIEHKPKPIVAVAPPPPPPTPIDVNAFAARYKSVGAELKAFEIAKGDAAASDLQARFRMIRFAEAVSTQDKRDAAAAILARIHAELARLSR